jgi:chromosome segregation ATPase
MRLFRKKTDEPNQIDVLRAEMVDLQQRLDSADQQKTELRSMVDAVDQRVGEVDARVGDFTQRVGTVTELSGQVRALADRLDIASTKVPPPTHPPPTRPPPPPPQDPRINELLIRIDDLAGKVTDHSGRIDNLAGKVTDHSGRINAAQAALSAADVARTDREQARLAELAAIQQSVDELAAQLADAAADPNAGSADDIQVVQQQVGQMTEKMSALDNRMNKVSLELANQLTELSNDLDVLLDQADTTEEPSANDAVAANTLVSEAIGAVQRSTEKLAAEQARYEIQFRADLAELADLFRRPPNSGTRSTRG